MSSKDLPMKPLDMLLVGLTMYLVYKTCNPDTPAKAAAPSTDNTPALGSDGTITQPLDTPALPDPPDEDEVGPQGMPASEGFANDCEMCPPGLPEDQQPPGGCCAEGFTATPAPAPIVTPGKSCPPSMIYTKKHLPTADSEEGCWPGNAPRGGGSLTSKCIPGGVAKVANFYDAAQTQTVIDAIDRDPTREMKIRQAPATANYDLRASPPITFNGYPSMSFIKGNTNVGLKQA